MKINRTWIFPILLLIIIIVLSLLAYNQIMTKTTLGEADIKNRVESLFNGEVESITNTNDQYKVAFLKNGYLYEVIVDEVGGTFSKLALLDEGEAKEEPSAEQEQKEETPVPEEKQTLKPLTEKEIIAIARSQFDGEVEEIEFVDTGDGGYYNVDMENEEDEATLQIHALTGDIITITYDD